MSRRPKGLKYKVKPLPIRSKICAFCNDIFHAEYGRSAVSWANAKFCSRKCRSDKMRGQKGFFRGRKHTAESRLKMREMKLGERNMRWQGNLPSYQAAHSWLKRHYGKAQKCEVCGTTRKVQWANKSQRYLRDRTDWKEMCQSHHFKYDRKTTAGIPRRVSPR